MLLPIPLVAITISVVLSIALYYIRLPSSLLPPVVEFYHIGFPVISSKETVLLESNQENAYKSCSPLPNVNPRWPQLDNEEPVVCLIQADE
jgi:hypothetical protein